MVKITKRIEAHYEVQNVKMGKVYRWCPESVVIQCDCGEKPTLTASRTICSRCGVNHTTIAEEVLDTARPEDNVDHPWRTLQPYYTPIRGV